MCYWSQVICMQPVAWAHTDATPISLLLFHVKDGTVITTATHEPSLFLLCVKDNSEIMTLSLFLLCIEDNSEIWLQVSCTLMSRMFLQLGRQHMPIPRFSWLLHPFNGYLLPKTLYQSQRSLLLLCVLREHSQLQHFYSANFAGAGLLLNLFQRPQILCCRLFWMAQQQVISCCFASMNAQQLQWWMIHFSWLLYQFLREHVLPQSLSMQNVPSWLLFTSRNSKHPFTSMKIAEYFVRENGDE